MINLHVNIEQSSAEWKNAFPRMRVKIEQAAAVAFLMAKKPAAFKKGDLEVNLLLANDRTIKKLNDEFRGMNKPTNVLSFPAAPAPKSKSKAAKAPVSLGDIIIASGIVKKECKAEKKTLENHTIHLVVHGVLHLLGYDHMTDKEAKIMEKLECDILESLGYPDPYHENIAQKGRR